MCALAKPSHDLLAATCFLHFYTFMHTVAVPRTSYELDECQGRGWVTWGKVCTHTSLYYAPVMRKVNSSHSSCMHGEPSRNIPLEMPEGQCCFLIWWECSGHCHSAVITHGREKMKSSLPPGFRVDELAWLTEHRSSRWVERKHFTVC